MTTFYCREYYDNYIINIEGHSDFAFRGADIVCAGVSTLSFTLLNCLCDEEAGGNIKFIKKISNDGYMYLEFTMYDFAKARIKGIIDSVVTGFLMLEDSYPENVKVC